MVCFFVYFQYIHAIVQLLDSDWPGALSPDGVCALAQAWLGTGLELKWACYNIPVTFMLISIYTQ